MSDINVSQNVEVSVESPKVGTAESVELLREMEEAAVKNIVHRIKVDDNMVNAEIVVFQKPMMEDRYKVFFKFKLNGKLYTCIKEVQTYDWRKTEESYHYRGIRMATIQTLYEFMSQTIAQELIRQSPELLK